MKKQTFLADWKGAVTLTFDDGWKSIYENAFPILQTAQIAATHYVISGYLDDSQFPAYLNAQQIRALTSAGHEIGCHTASHKHLPEESASMIESEVKLSLRFLRKLAIPVETFAYPFGQYDERVVATVKSAGFSGARSVIPGFNDESADHFLLQCQEVNVRTSLDEVIGWIESARETQKWLILVFHQIDEEGRAYSARPQTFAQIVDHLRKKSIKTLTVREGLRSLVRPAHP